MFKKILIGSFWFCIIFIAGCSDNYLSNEENINPNSQNSQPSQVDKTSKNGEASQNWKQYDSQKLNISFQYLNDGSYFLDSSNPNKLIISQGEHPGDKFTLQRKPGACEIQADGEDDALINGNSYTKFYTMGMGDPYGYYIEKNKDCYIFETIWGPENETFEQIVKSIEFNDNINDNISINENQDQVKQKHGSKIISIDENWNQYIDYDLDFKIKFPKFNEGGEGQKEVELVKSGSVVYITTKDSFIYEEMQEKKSNSSDYLKAKGVSFAILVKKAENDEDINNYLQNRYAAQCSIKSKKKNENDYLDIEIDTGSADPNNPDSCFINYLTKVKYSPEKNLIASWDLGQACNFMVEGECADPKMVESFEFVE